MVNAEIETTAVTCLHEFLESQADARPDGVALICGDTKWSYQELDQRTNQLARYLRAHGVGPGSLVGLFLRRSEKSVLAILAVLKAGAAYVPIEATSPAERARHIVNEAEIAVLLTERDCADQTTSWFKGTCVVVDGSERAVAAQSTSRLTRDETGVAPNDLCYVLYTSGTTGRPKGVMTEHRNVAQFVEAFNEVCQLSASDRVYHGFALSFDGSVEEMWMAFSNGATLVVGTEEIASLGSAAARLFTEQEITVFSTVPTCLGMIHADLPTLRLIILSGEPCPPELVRKCARPGRRVLNVYGPTETTVNATAVDCYPDQPVTIGRPLRGYEAYVLDANMQPVAPGEAGELYLGGVGVARGYLGQPELTDRHFISTCLNGTGDVSTVYRTGDLVKRTDGGELLFLGRIDRQVKIRGYRIELAEIESVLREHPMVDQAVVNVTEREGQKELAAYVVLVDPGQTLECDDALQWLRQRVPNYMIPAYLDRLEALPTVPSGKVDRRRLPEPRTPLVSSRRQLVPPSTPIEEQVAAVWEDMLKISPLSVDDDFFMDLGGYSLLAAEMVSKLRIEHGLDFAIRDVYQHPTIRQLASRASTLTKTEMSNGAPVDQQARRCAAREAFESLPRLARWSCLPMQTLSMIVIYGVASLPVTAAVLLTLAAAKSTITTTSYLWLLSAVVFLAPPLGILLAIAVKWTVIGRYKPGRYPVWSWYYFRWWLVTRFQSLAWVDIYAGTPLMSLYYRLMGAEVGKNCIFDSPHAAIFDLLSVGDDSSIGAETQYLGYRVEGGMLIIGRVDIGDRCFVGTQSCLGIDTRMQDDASLDDLSLLPDGAVIAAGESYKGSPAKPDRVHLPEISLPQAGRPRPVRRRTVLFGLLHFLAAESVGEIFLLAAILPMMLCVCAGYMLGGLAGAGAATLVGIPLAILTFCLFVAGVKAIVLPRNPVGVFPVASWKYLKHWSVDLLLRVSNGLLYPLSTTIYFPYWLRLLGARIGARAELSTVTQMTPDLIEIGDESFLADGSIVGGRRLFRGHVELGRNRIGCRTFLGNSAILPGGANLGNNCLVGVLSTPPAAVDATECEAEWLGSPPFRLPNRQKEGGFKLSTTYRPTMGLYLLRFAIDALRVLLPYYVAVLALILYTAGVVAGTVYLPIWAVLAVSPLVAVCVVIATVLYVVGIKHVLMGTFRPAKKPLWSSYIWFNEVVNGVYETVTQTILYPILGTPFMSWYLRLLGCKIGKHAFIDTELFSEFDLVNVDDYAALNAGAVIQNHLFEDRIMKSSYLHIGQGCSVGNMSVVLYDTQMQRGSSIGPLSLLMKGESLPGNTRWIGIPTGQVD